MKNYNQFINQEQLNEELLGFLGKQIKKLWKKGWEKYRKHKGVKEVEKIYNEAEEKINNMLEDQKRAALQKFKEKSDTTSESNKNFNLLKFYEFITEAEEKELSDFLTPEAAREISKLLDEKIDIIIENSKREMDEVLRKKGGREKNRLLHHLIQLKKEDLRMYYIEHKINFLNEVGDKKTLKEEEVKRDKLQKQLEQGYNKLDEIGLKTTDDDEVKVEIGNLYRFKTEDGIKTIEVVGESDDEGMVKAKYLHDEDGSTEEDDFQISNIESNFKPENEKKYNYLNTNGDIVEVKVINNEVKNGEATVEIIESGNEINVFYGRLRDLEGEGEKIKDVDDEVKEE